MSGRGSKASPYKRKLIDVASSEDEDDDFQVVKFEKKKQVQVSASGRRAAPANLPDVVTENSVPVEDESEKDTDVNDDAELSKLYSCPLCPSYACENYRTMKTHIKQKHAGVELDGKKLTAGQRLVTDTVKIQEIKRIPKKTYKFPCTYKGCQRGFDRAVLLQEHLASHSDKYKFCCTACGRLEHITGYMRKHYFNNHEGIPFDQKSCTNLMHLLYEDEEKNGTKVEQPVYLCRMCEKSFEFPHQLKSHLPNHDLVPRTCSTCGKIFKSPRNCAIYMRIHDPTFVEFKCTKADGCTKRCGDAIQLRRHEKYAFIHNPQSKFECAKCQRKFYSPMHVKKHQKNPCPPPTREPRYRCKIETCKKGFFHEKNLKKHEQRHDNGTLNLQVPPDHVIKMYQRMINVCTEQIHIDSCNKNKPRRKAGSHLVVTPCNQTLADGSKCQKKAVMYTSAPTPWHHIRMLLCMMIKGRACTSLHSHCEGEGHEMVVAAAKFVDGGVDNYEMQMVKKMVVKMAKKETPVNVTYHTEYEIYHVYHESAITEVIKIMTDEGLTSKSEDHLRTDINEHLEKVLNGGGTTTVRKHSPLIFKHDLFQFAKKVNDDMASEEAELEMLDELAEDDDSGIGDMTDEEEDEEE